MDHPVGYEKKDLNVKKVVWNAVIVVVVLVISLVILNDWFIKTKEELYQEMVLQPKNPELLTLRAREETLLNSYGIADSTGAYRIPIDSAIALIAAEAVMGGKTK